MKLTDMRRYVLEALSEAGEDFGYLSFSAIAAYGTVPPHLIRRTVRSLARDGMAEYGRGLWTEDGEPAGSGYRITDAGRAALRDGGEG